MGKYPLKLGERSLQSDYRSCRDGKIEIRELNSGVLLGSIAKNLLRAMWTSLQREREDDSCGARTDVLSCAKWCGEDDRGNRRP
jgi:hypothetical protein